MPLGKEAQFTVPILPILLFLSVLFIVFLVYKGVNKEWLYTGHLILC